MGDVEEARVTSSIKEVLWRPFDVVFAALDSPWALPTVVLVWVATFSLCMVEGFITAANTQGEAAAERGKTAQARAYWEMVRRPVR